MINSLTKTWREFSNDTRGVTALEYGLLAGLIAVALIGVLTTFSSDLANLFGNVDKAVTAVDVAS
jgi:pilus assembly protein Flp/PilA